MYEFATIALIGLGVAKLVDLVGHANPVSRTVRALIALVLGLAIAWATDYSVFAGWGVRFRALWMGPVATGIAIAGMAALWHEVLDFLACYARRARGRTDELDSRVPRAA